MKFTMTGRAALLALTSRLLVLSCIVLFQTAFSDLDTSARLQVRPCDRSNAATESPVKGTLGQRFLVWDTAHFVRIAKCGYETDMLAAFFPLLPAAMRLAARGAAGLLPWAADAQEEALLVLGGLATSLATFCASATVFHRLSLRTLKDRRLADLSLLLFCFNPASVFYSAAYTESLYAAASFLGLWLLPTHHWAAVGTLVAASAARSNGMLNCWFVAHKLLFSWRLHGRLALGEVASTTLSCLLILAPYVAMQGFGYLTYCRSGLLDLPEWCHWRLPSLYGYIQRRYWGVGFLQFYRDPTRLPMIATALPVAYISTRGCYEYWASDPLRALTLGLYSSRDPSLPPAVLKLAVWLNAKAPAGGAQRGQGQQEQRLGYFGSAVAPYIYHWALLTAVALLVMNVHVATRFLSACPSFYWYTSHYISGSLRGASKARATWVWAWIWSYTALGCLMFPNHYPWT